MLSPVPLKPQTPVDVREELGTSLPRTANESRHGSNLELPVIGTDVELW